MVGVDTFSRELSFHCVCSPQCCPPRLPPAVDEPPSVGNAVFVEVKFRYPGAQHGVVNRDVSLCLVHNGESSQLRLQSVEEVKGAELRVTGDGLEGPEGLCESLAFYWSWVGLRDCYA